VCGNEHLMKLLHRQQGHFVLWALVARSLVCRHQPAIRNMYKNSSKQG